MQTLYRKRLTKNCSTNQSYNKLNRTVTIGSCLKADPL